MNAGASYARMGTRPLIVPLNSHNYGEYQCQVVLRDPMKNRIRSDENDRAALAFDAQALETLLNVGGDDLRGPLCVQLAADFLRLNSAISTEVGADLARAAHELKGLAATIGAERLTELARSLDTAAETLPAAAHGAMVNAVQTEIAVIQEALSQAAQATTRGAKP